MTIFLLTTIHSLVHAHMLVLNADVNNISRYLEAYLMWLFYYVLFNNNHKSIVDKVLMSYIRAIIDVEEDNISVWS
jgi:hypothetical protein